MFRALIDLSHYLHKLAITFKQRATKRVQCQEVQIEGSQAAIRLGIIGINNPVSPIQHNIRTPILLTTAGSPIIVNLTGSTRFQNRNPNEQCNAATSYIHSIQS